MSMRSTATSAATQTGKSPPSVLFVSMIDFIQKSSYPFSQLTCPKKIPLTPQQRFFPDAENHKHAAGHVSQQVDIVLNSRLCEQTFHIRVNNSRGIAGVFDRDRFLGLRVADRGFDVASGFAHDIFHLLAQAALLCADFGSECAQRASQHVSMLLFELHLLGISEFAIVLQTLQGRNARRKSVVERDAILGPFDFNGGLSEFSFRFE